MISHLLTRNVTDLIDKIETIIIEKDYALARRDFSTAKDLRALQDFILTEINRLVPKKIAITFVAIIRVLRTLGFDGELLPGA
jgi:hypothetical protein